jgi:2-polyprenyl-3-methyl-5-hydroxy-6-metoxy-1,4-benzoquinol methylase
MKPGQCLVCQGVLQPSLIPQLLCCRSCGFITADAVPSNEDLQKLYSKQYFTGDEYRDYVAERRTIEKQFRLKMRRLLGYVANPREKRLLEIGCAYGFFLSVAREYFGTIEGVDISGEAVRHATDVLHLPAQPADFLDYDTSGDYDVVCLWDTIEHLVNPHLYLEKVSRHLKQGGIVAITTGDISSLMARVRGRKWRQIHPPTHLHYFSRRTLTQLLLQYGLKVRYCGYDGMYRRVDTMAYITLCVRRKYGWFYQRLKNAGLLDWDIYLNLKDIMLVIAVKD